MTQKSFYTAAQVTVAFDTNLITLPLDDIIPTRVIPDSVSASSKIATEINGVRWSGPLFFGLSTDLQSGL
jgi:hypothetical protein